MREDKSGKQKPEEGIIIGDSSDRPISLMTYVILNLIFWAYCAVQLLVLKWLLREIAGLYFFFAILAAAFTIVSIYDYLYDRLAPKSRETDYSDTSSIKE